jgi:outer membrane protein assembly factor BamB
MFRDRFCWVVIIFLLCISPQRLYSKRLPQRKQKPAPLVRPELLERARLAVVWQSNLVLDEPERLGRLFIRGDSIYAITNQNYLYGLNKRDGRIRFGKLLASKGFSVFGPQLYEDDLFFTAGNKLLQIDTEFGRTVDSKHFTFTTTLPVVRNAKHIYVAGNDRRLHVFDAESKLEEFQVAADNGSLMTSVIVDDEYVVFSTEEGNVVSILPGAPVRRWQFDTAGTEASRLIADDESVYVSSRDTNLYRLNVRTGKMMSKFHTGAALVCPARLTEKNVYQYARRHGLYVIDKESGKQIWQLDEGVNLLTEAGDKAYVITSDNTIVVIDNRTGKKLYSVNLAGVLVYVSGSPDSHIYIGDGLGRLACLKPTR